MAVYLSKTAATMIGPSRFPAYFRSSLEFPPLSICVNIYALRLGSYYFHPMEYRGMNIAHPLCAGYKNRLLINTYA